MRLNGFTISVVASSIFFSFSGCSNLPGSPGQQGAVVGGASGAAVGAAVSQNRALGAVIGGAVGAAGGYVVGHNKDKILGHDNDANAASKKAQERPVTPEQARTATTADVNGDGYVTMDEIAALKAGGLSDEEMIQRLEATGQVFTLTEDQQRVLLTQGVTQHVIDEMLKMNRPVAVPKATVPNTDVIGRPR